MNERFEAGRVLTDAMMGETFGKRMEDAAISGGFGADMARLAMEQAFGDTWQREGLDRKTRSIVTLSVLIAREHWGEVRNHVRFGLNNGLTPRELEEIVFQTQPYLGFPVSGQAMGVVGEVLREMGLAAGLSSKERGLI